MLIGALEMLIDGLDREYSVDYWYDHMKATLGAELDTLSDEDWSRLIGSLDERSAGWRVRLAQAAFLADNPRVMNLLFELLKSPEAEVGSAVAETLLEMGSSWSPEISPRADLERHLQNARPEERRPIERLLMRY